MTVHDLILAIGNMPLKYLLWIPIGYVAFLIMVWGVIGVFMLLLEGLDNLFGPQPHLTTRPKPPPPINVDDSGYRSPAGYRRGIKMDNSKEQLKGKLK